MSERAKSRLWWPVLLALVAAVCLFTAYRGTSKLQAAQKELAMVASTNEKLDQENRALYRQVMRLRSDPKALEKAARQDMGMVRPGEVIYQEPGAKE